MTERENGNGHESKSDRESRSELENKSDRENGNGHEKIGIFGGTFDPVHMGHLFLAETAYDAAGLDRVLFMPSPDPYYRTDKKVTDDVHRVNMVKLAIEGNPHFEFSDFELGLKGTTYTADTLEKFKKLHPDAEVYFIMGGDSVFSIENWKDPEKIFSQAVILSSKREREAEGASGSCAPTGAGCMMQNGDAPRGCISEESGNFMQNSGGAGDILEDNFARQVRYLSEKYGARIINIQLPNIDISSSDIIRRIRAGKSIRYYVPDAVAEYIQENKLYR